MMKRFTATIIQGHRVASGLNGNPAFPGWVLWFVPETKGTSLA